jgi:hypothetical protein
MNPVEWSRMRLKLRLALMPNSAIAAENDHDAGRSFEPAPGLSRSGSHFLGTVVNV